MAAIQNEVSEYVKTLTEALREEFGERLLYVGLQVSCMRGEPQKTATSISWQC